MKTLAILLIIGSSVAFSSCKKCYHCEAIDTVTGDVWDSEYVCGQDEKDDYMYLFSDPAIQSQASCTRD